MEKTKKKHAYRRNYSKSLNENNSLYTYQIKIKQVFECPEKKMEISLLRI
jgi:hypothetical protein